MLEIGCDGTVFAVENQDHIANSGPQACIELSVPHKYGLRGHSMTLRLVIE